MPYLRFTRDRRGYENTFLLHAAYPGERPGVLYWYRTAPEVRVGRAALDPAAIREIETAHPEILFDWSEILEVGATAQPEVETPRQPRKRKAPPRPRDEGAQRRPPHPPEPAAHAAPPSSAEAAPDDAEPASLPPVEEMSEAEAAVAEEIDTVFVHDATSPPALPTSSLLDELVGRGIATRLRGCYAELVAHLSTRQDDEAVKDAWRRRIEALNPDAWVTAEEVMAGISKADALYETLRDELT